MRKTLVSLLLAFAPMAFFAQAPVQKTSILKGGNLESHAKRGAGGDSLGRHAMGSFPVSPATKRGGDSLGRVGFDDPNYVPPTRTCATHEKMAQSLAAHPELALQREQYERDLAELLANSPNYNKATGVITVPVVVHVVYRTTTQNISDAQIQSQITALNADYAALNTDVSSVPSVWTSLVANTGIQFCMAQRDPQGNATTGITRTQTTISGIGQTNSYYTAAPAWDRTKYLNIWVCDIGGGILGFAYQPNTAPASYDGVVIDYRYFGTMGTATYPYNKGRTATHEVGHWFNLDHIWGDDNGACSGSDNVSDTPNQADANGGCPSFPRTDACSPSSPGVMWMNYMDYTDDRCMYMFTNGQATRMNAALNGARSGLLFSNGCLPPGGGGGGGGVACSDTLDHPLVGTAALYTAQSPEWGYVAGHNSYLDISKANYYANTAGYPQIEGIMFTFGAAAAAGANSAITVKVWDDNAGTPGTVLHSQTLLINDIINAAGEVTVTFPSAVNLSGAFYAGFSMTYAAGDTVGLLTNTDGDTNPGNAWEEFSDNSWHNYSESPTSWGINVSNAIFPIVTGAPLAISVSPANPNISSGGSVSLTASGANTYTWTPSSGLSATTGATVTASPTTTTTYTVTGTSTDGSCTGTTTVTVTVGGATSVDNALSGAISVFPNPSNGIFTVAYNQVKRSDVAITVFNSLGQEVYAEHLSGFAGELRRDLNLSTLTRGIYFIRISDGENQHTTKLRFE